MEEQNTISAALNLTALFKLMTPNSIAEAGHLKKYQEQRGDFKNIDILDLSHLRLSGVKEKAWVGILWTLCWSHATICH